MIARARPRPTLFPYTTLFRSQMLERPGEWNMIAQKGSAFLRKKSPARPALAKPHGGEGGLHRASQVADRSEEHTSELQSQSNLVCRLLPEKKKMLSLLGTACL